MAIYKYYPDNCNSLCAVKEHYFWFSTNVALNDPFDMAGDLFKRFPKFGEAVGMDRFDIHKYEESVKKMAICCFSKCKMNKHLWALYASSYSGFVLGFDEKKLDSFHENILYRDCFYRKDIPNFENAKIKIPYIDKDKKKVKASLSTLMKSEILLNKVFEYYLLIKDKKVWEIEQEKRLILSLDYIRKNPAKDPKGYKIPWPEDSVTEIIWGSRIRPKLKKEIESFLPPDIKKTTVQKNSSENVFSLITSAIRDNY